MGTYKNHLVSFEHPKQMFKLIDKKILTIFRPNFLSIAAIIIDVDSPDNSFLLLCFVDDRIIDVLEAKSRRNELSIILRLYKHISVQVRTLRFTSLTDHTVCLSPVKRQKMWLVVITTQSKCLHLPI